jgi:hypothetical protein
VNVVLGEDGALDCAGAPRDLGLAQGAALRDTLRAQAARDGALLAPLAPAGGVHGLESLARIVVALRERVSTVQWRSDTRHLSRDVSRHFPQLAERLEGLARGAAVPVPWLLSRLARGASGDASATPDAADGAGIAAALQLARSEDGTLRLVRRVDAATPLVLRRSAPDGGLRSLEVVTPCGVAAWAGVNESGLALAVAPAPSTAQRPCRFAAPAALFVQECLQRFDAVGPAAAWCLDRPAAGSFDLLLLDASGAVAAVRTDGETRERIEPMLAAGNAGSLTARNAESLTADAGTLVLLDPVARTLTQLGSDGQRVRLAVEVAGERGAQR